VYSSRCRWWKPIATLAGVTAAGVTVLIAGCGSTQDSPPRGSLNTVPASSAATSAPATPAGLPEAADGTDLHACADGRCEVRVAPAAQIPVPSSLWVGSLRVQSISSDEVTIVGRDVGNHHGGGCSGNCSGGGSNDGFKLTLGPGGSGSENKLSIALVAIGGGAAVLRLAPV
jgi:hypothetical protein